MMGHEISTCWVVNATRLRLRYLSVNKYLTPAGGVFQLGKTLNLGLRYLF